jgi:hypothetical protein
MAQQGLIFKTLFIIKPFQREIIMDTNTEKYQSFLKIWNKANENKMAITKVALDETGKMVEFWLVGTGKIDTMRLRYIPAGIQAFSQDGEADVIHTYNDPWDNVVQVAWEWYQKTRHETNLYVYKPFYSDFIRMGFMQKFPKKYGRY